MSLLSLPPTVVPNAGGFAGMVFYTIRLWWLALSCIKKIIAYF